MAQNGAKQRKTAVKLRRWGAVDFTYPPCPLFIILDGQSISRCRLSPLFQHFRVSSWAVLLAWVGILLSKAAVRGMYEKGKV